MSLRRLHYRESQSMRTRSAWCDYDARFDCVFSKDFKAGWLVGYYDVVTGGTGIPPIVPPKKYWRPAQVIDKCDAGRLEWYRGFQAGAECAGYVPDSHDIKLWMPPRCELACPPAELVVPPTSGKPVPSSESPETTDEPYNPSTEPPNADPDESPMDLPTPDSEQIPDPNLRQETPPRVPLDLPPKSQTDTPAPLKEVIADISGSGPIAESSAALTLLSETGADSEGPEFYVPEPVESASSDAPAITTVVSPAAITSVRPEPMPTKNPPSAAFSNEPRDFIVLKSPQTGSEVAMPIPTRSATQAARAMQGGSVSESARTTPATSTFEVPPEAAQVEAETDSPAAMIQMPEIEEEDAPARLSLDGLPAPPMRETTPFVSEQESSDELDHNEEAASAVLTLPELDNVDETVRLDLAEDFDFSDEEPAATLPLSPAMNPEDSSPASVILLDEVVMEGAGRHPAPRPLGPGPMSVPRSSERNHASWSLAQKAGPAGTLPVHLLAPRRVASEPQVIVTAAARSETNGADANNTSGVIRLSEFEEPEIFSTPEQASPGTLPVEPSGFQTPSLRPIESDAVQFSVPSPVRNSTPQ
jgi:hypothetical protein